MFDSIRRFTYPLAVTAVVATTWVCAWSRSLHDAAAPGYWPAADPELMRRVLDAPPTQEGTDADPPDRRPSRTAPPEGVPPTRRVTVR